MHLNNTIKGAILVILSAFFFALEYLLFDAVFQVVDISPQSALFWSLLTTVLVVAPFFVFDKKQRQKLATTIRRDTKTVLAVSVVSTIGFYLVVWAVAQSNSGITSLLHETKLIFIPLMGVFLLHEQLNRIQLAGISIAICGFVFISSLRGEVSLVVVLALLLSALLYSLQSFFTKKYAPGLSGGAFSFLRTVFMTLLLGAMMIALRDSFGLPSLDLLLLLAGAGVFGTFISQMFYFEAHNLLPISVLNVYSLFQPVFVLIGSIIFLQAPVSTIKIIGAVCIVAGLLLVTRGQAHKNQARDQ